ncbi:uncharacterized protein LOC115634653 [Scaptodrosophila lebanonensis]|uniref:Uncharacterized protein LOC115634653 n=1 Tax=Drosophila lebanonensis TaxID=7225 RepID=A0A6J2UJK1_DROLE|nr:uncharacterized protein LOC115634653 [Scaptodrosophila lebanonensis]
MAQCDADPVYLDTYDGFSDSDSELDYATSFGKPLSRERVKSLDPGYYYINNGHIAPVYDTGRTSSEGYSLRFAPVQLYTWTCLLLGIIASQIVHSSAKPATLELDSIDDYGPTYGKPLTKSYLRSLDTGYYYVDGGYISPVYDSSASGRRNLKIYGSSPGYVRFEPLVGYRQTHAKRKKLFVPNLFG